MSEIQNSKYILAFFKPNTLSVSKDLVFSKKIGNTYDAHNKSQIYLKRIGPVT